MKTTITNEFEAHKKTIEDTMSIIEVVQEAAEIAIKTLKHGGKILFCGNGGSAADAQHIAAELSGRYKVERRGLPGLALTTDTSVLTAVGNDYGYDRVFDRQVEALANKGDLLIGTSGNSQNVINAFRVVRELGCSTIGMSGREGGKFNGECDLNIIIPSNDTPRIQEMHILVGHTLCQLIDEFVN